MNGARPLVRLAIFAILLVSIRCAEEGDIDVPQHDLSKAFFYFYGYPTGTTAAIPFYSESPSRTPAQIAEPVAQLSMTGRISAAGLVVHQDGSLTPAPWEASYDSIAAWLNGAPPEIDNLPTYITDQIVVQKMVYFTDLLSSPVSSSRRTDLVTQFLETLSANRFPRPELYVKLLDAVQLELPAERVGSFARAALNANKLYISELASLKDSCQQCFEYKVRGKSETEQRAYDSALEQLERMSISQ
jgi:hypothetical protein